MKKPFAFISGFSFMNIRVITVLIILLLVIGANAQSRRLNDGSTPLGIAPGSPAGSFALSDLDTINPYNGNLNFRLPLINIGGRGSSGYTVTLPINYRWTVFHQFLNQNQDFQHHPTNYRPYYTIRPSYRAGKFEVRNVEEIDCNQYGGGSFPTLTTIIFTAADGTEYEFRSEALDGAPGGVNCIGGGGSSRGTIWKTSDGSFLTFISDTVIYDYSFTGAHNLFGYLMFPDGTKYRIEAGRVSWIRDRNGNITTFTYGGTYTESPLVKVTDSIGREITFAYDIQDSGQYGLHDQIIYKGFGGQTRTIRISYKSLSEVLRSDQTIQTYQALFGELDTTGVYNPTNQIAAVWLPNGQAYRFYYNSYNELARVELPTGGAYEYDWGASNSGGTSGVVLVANPNLIYFPEIYRQVLTKRIYPEGGTGNTFALKTTFSQTQGQGTTTSSKTLEQRDASNNLLGQTKHYFYGNPIPSHGSNIYFKPAWDEGREYQTEIFDIVSGNPVLKRHVNQTWEKGVGTGYNEGNARAIETITTLVDSNQVAKTTGISPVDGSIGFDQFNNPTDVWEYDYGTGAAGAFKRRTHTDYVADTNYIAYTGSHLRGLPAETWVSSDSAGNNKVSKTEFKYDETTLESRSNVVGWTNPNSLYKGNLTKTRNWVKYGSEPEVWLESKAEYDVLGNVVKTIDAKNNASTISYADNFGSSDNEARTNSAPTQLNGQSTFALPTSATNALQWVIGYSQFDYFTGAAVNAEDINGVISKTLYNDTLDRPTQTVTADGTSLEIQSNIIYDDANKRIETKSDLNALNDNLIKTESFYDGLGRTVKTRRYESDGTFITTESVPFTMVQEPGTSILRAATKVSNPYRAGETVYWTTSLSDSLGRTIKVIAPDGTIVKTEYIGNAVTVTDQAGKQRRSITNALGQLKEVHEPNNAGQLGATASPNQPTNYSYDILNNLLQVQQIGVNTEQCGGTTSCTQTRTFAYDSLSRLKQTTNPESGTIDYIYDNNGNLTNKTDSGGVQTTYAYDALNRVTSRSYLNEPAGQATTPTVTYTYDNLTNSKGRLTKVATTLSTTEYTEFDFLGRVKKSKQTTDGTIYPEMEYVYNLSGVLIEQKYPSGRVVQNFLEADGDLAAISSKVSNGQFKNYASNFSYTAAGVVQHLQLGNGLWESAKLNGRQQVTELNLGTSPTDGSLWKLNYDYGELDTNGNVDWTKNSGNIAKQTISFSGLAQPFVQTYKYDSLNRITEAKETNNGNQTWIQTFGYDRYGNRTEFSQNVHGQQLVINNQTLPQINPNTNRFQTGQGYQYDSGGNLVQDTTGRQFVFNGDNKQIEVRDASNNIIGRYFYDGNGKRVKKITNTETVIFVYDGVGRLVAEYSTAAPVPNPTVNYTVTDPLSSPRVITNKQGQIISRRDFMPFGEDLMPDATYRTTALKYNYGDTIRQKFTSYQRDEETGLDFAEARYYNNRHGRFTAVDPLLASGKLANPQTFNRYVYTMNRPLILTDSTGLQASTDESEITVNSAAFPNLVLYDNRTASVTNADGRTVNFTLVELSNSDWLSIVNNHRAGNKFDERQIRLLNVFRDMRGEVVGEGDDNLDHPDLKIKSDRGGFWANAGLKIGNFFRKLIGGKQPEKPNPIQPGAFGSINLKGIVEKSGMSLPQAGKFFGWRDKGVIPSKTVKDFTRQQLEEAGWTKELIEATAKAYREVAARSEAMGVTNPSAIPRAEQLESLLELFK